MISDTIFRLLTEAEIISKRGKLSPEDKVRHSTIMSTVAVLRSEGGADAYSPEQQYRAAEQRAKLVRAYREIANGLPVNEVRANQLSGQGTITGSTTAAGGAFVPVQFAFSGLQIALAAHDPLFDENKVTLISTKSGAALELPLISDVSVKATPVTEAASDTTHTNIAIVGNAENQTYVYRTPKIATSMEFGEDAMGDFNVAVLENVFAQRIARGVGYDMISGNSAGHITGLVPQLETLGVTPITAAGSSSDDGSGNTGANSIGSQDLRNLYFSVNSAYRASPKCAWLMNDATLLAIAGLRDAQKRPLNLVRYESGVPMIYGKPVHVSPSCPSIAVSAQGVVIFGDLSRWITRQVPGDNYVKVYREAPGLIENGLVGWSCFARYGGQLLATDPLASPINYLSMHS